MLSFTRFTHLLKTLAGLALFALGAVLSAHYTRSIDVTAQQSNTLSLASQKLLTALPDTLSIKAYIKKGHATRLQIAQLIARYQRHKNNIQLSFIDPNDIPNEAKHLALGNADTLIISYQHHTEKLHFLDETTLSNALLHLSHTQKHWISYLTGHGERNFQSHDNTDLGQFSARLLERSITAVPLNLSTHASMPSNTELLVLSAPSAPLLTEEIKLIKDYLKKNGSLLLLLEPNNRYLDDILSSLNLKRSQQLEDKRNKLAGLEQPTFIIEDQYPSHPITRDLHLISVFPEVTGLEYINPSAKNFTPLLRLDSPTHPSQFAYTLTQANAPDAPPQRIVVMGDGDFLSNAYLGYVGNAELGLRIMTWLLHDDSFIDVPSTMHSAQPLQLSKIAVTLIGFGYLLVLPLGLIITGLIHWQWRKHRRSLQHQE